MMQRTLVGKQCGPTPPGQTGACCAGCASGIGSITESLGIPASLNLPLNILVVGLGIAAVAWLASD